MRTWSPLVRELGDAIADLTMLQAGELSEYLRAVHQIEPATRRIIVEPDPPDPRPPLPPTECSVQLEAYEPGRKLILIKTLRELFQLGIKEAKDLVEGAPRTRLGPMATADAERLKRKLEDAGATVKLIG
jgi:large subunit ribosomal protein L7/L12